MSAKNFHLVAIDLQFNRIYVIVEHQTREGCEQIIRDWSDQQMPDVVPVAWPVSQPLPDSLFAA